MLPRLLLLLLASCWPAWALCPTACTCYLDHKGRLAVSCKEGGLVGPLNLNNVSLDTETIEITAPDDNPNALTMSPVFQSYKKLEEIHVTKSNVPQLGMHFFYGLARLDVLDLSQNNITQPLDHNFRGLARLRELYLDDNRINSLPSGTFRYLPELKVLSVQRNRIEELTPRIFLEIGKLRVLKLSGNRLGELNPEVFRDVQELKYLECRGCALTRLNNEIYHLLPNVAHLDLGDNHIELVPPEELKDLSNLKHLKLDGNRIATLRNSTFRHQPALRKLNLARNRLARLADDALGGLANLTELDLSRNHLEHLDFLEPLEETLEVLDLSGNRLGPEALEAVAGLARLRELRLADCDLVHVDALPEGLRVLDLSGNHLSALPPRFLSLRLSEVDLSRNRFRGLEDGPAAVLERVASARLDGNLWSCDLCHIVPLLERVNGSVAFREIVCSAPFTVKGKRLGTLARPQLTWCTHPHGGGVDFFLVGEEGRVGIIVAGASLFLLVLTVVAVVGALCYSRRHAAKYYTHEDKLAVEGEAIFEGGANQSPLFCDGELSFRFPLDGGGSEKKISIATIDEIKKEHAISNGT